MLRRNVRLRKEYLYRKSIEDKERAVSDRKRKLKDALEGGKSIPTELRGADKRLRPTLDLDDDRTMQMRSQIDDEYAYAGVKDPKVLITTARDPSSRLAQFAKELRLLFPTSQRINRGAYILKDLVRLCQTNDVTDLVIVHEHRGEPDGLIVSHLPYGPTAYFGLSEVALRHDLPKKPPNISEVSPHLIFHQFESKLGRRVETILKHLFPPAAPLGQRCMSFINQGDFIHFRHHTWAKAKPGGGEAAAAAAAAAVDAGQAATGKDEAKERQPKGKKERAEEKQKEQLQLTEAGPRFVMRLYRIELGSVDMRDVEVEWSLKPFFNKPKAALA